MIVEIEGLQKIYEGKQRVVAVDGIDTRQRVGEFIHRRAFPAAPDRGDAHLLDPLEKGRAALLGQHPADHRAEPPDVLAQRAVVRQEFGLAVCFHPYAPMLTKPPAYRIGTTEASRERSLAEGGRDYCLFVLPAEGRCDR